MNRALRTSCAPRATPDLRPLMTMRVMLARRCASSCRPYLLARGILSPQGALFGVGVVVYAVVPLYTSHLPLLYAPC